MKLNSAGRTLRLGVITSTFPFGNGESFLSAELAALAGSDCSLTIFPAVPRGRQTSYPDLAAGVRRFSVLSPLTIYRAFFGFCLNARAALRALMVILHSRNTLLTKCKNLALFPSGLAVATDILKLGLHHIHAYWLTGPSTVAWIASEVTGVGWSYSAHSRDIFLEDNLIVEKAKSASFGRVISELGRAEIRRRIGEARSRPLEVIHLGVRIPNGVAAPIKMVKAGRIRLLCPAHFYYFKDHLSIVTALRKVLDAGIECQCVFAGEGSLRSSIARRIRELQLENVISMPGMVPHHALLEQLRSGLYDAVILASRDLEGIPVSLIEAMAVGVPCIATKTGAVAELIHPDSGLLVSEGDSHELAIAIINLASDPQRRLELGERAREQVAKAFDVNVTSHRLLTLMLAS